MMFKLLMHEICNTSTCIYDIVYAYMLFKRLIPFLAGKPVKLFSDSMCNAPNWMLP